MSKVAPFKRIAGLAAVSAYVYPTGTKVVSVMSKNMPISGIRHLSLLTSGKSVLSYHIGLGRDVKNVFCHQQRFLANKKAGLWLESLLKGTELNDP